MRGRRGKLNAKVKPVEIEDGKVYRTGNGLFLPGWLIKWIQEEDKKHEKKQHKERV